MAAVDLEDTHDRLCGEPTEAGEPCRRQVFGLSDRCHRHAGLPPTPAEQDASRRNPVRHGGFAACLRKEELGDYQASRGDLQNPAEVKRDFAAYMMTRAKRVGAWEAQGNELSPRAAAIFDAFGRALDKVPAPAESKQDGPDPEQLARLVEALASKPEVFIKRLPPAVQEEVRAVLRKAGLS